MRIRGPVAASLLAATLLSVPLTVAPALAQQPAARAAKEPTAGQMAARQRQKTCGAEWKAAKAGGKTAGQTWPKFWSSCNARLKGRNV